LGETVGQGAERNHPEKKGTTVTRGDPTHYRKKGGGDIGKREKLQKASAGAEPLLTKWKGHLRSALNPKKGSKPKPRK